MLGKFFEAYLWLQLVIIVLLFAWCVRLGWNDWKRSALMALTARLPVKVLQRPGEPRYVEWYHVATPFNLFRVHIHRFVGDDPDGLHDHPWDWAVSLLLLGEYDEERRGRGGLRVRRRRFGYWMSGEVFHRVRLPSGAREVWTLFIFGPYTKSWGFLRPQLQSERWGYVWLPRAGHERRFDAWPATAPTGRKLREVDEIDSWLGAA